LKGTIEEHQGEEKKKTLSSQRTTSEPKPKPDTQASKKKRKRLK